MLRPKMMVGSGCLLMILLTGGFILLLRSCLSKYDERSAKLPAIIVTGNGNSANKMNRSNNDTALIFSIVAFDKTTSYSSGRGITHKTVNTTYSVQTNDINTAKKIKHRDLKEHQDIKEWPVRILGYSVGSGVSKGSNSSGDLSFSNGSGGFGFVWIFMGELMAFDAMTLEKVADIQKLEEINPSLKSKFPKEARYYEFEKDLGLILFTATDGIKWQLDPLSLKTSTRATNSSIDKYKKSLDSIENLQAINTRLKDSVFEKYSLIPGRDYRDKKIGLETYHSMQNKMVELRAKLNNESDLLRAAYLRVRSEKQFNEQTKSAINSLGRINPGYRQMGTSLDTLNNQWIGIYDENELRDLSTHIYMRRATDETARRFMVSGKIIYDKNNQASLDLTTATLFRDVPYLDGSLLLNKETAVPFRLPGNRYLIIHKDLIGTNGKVLVSATNDSGQLLWTAETGLKSWFDWKLDNNSLIIFGQDNRELMSDDSNVLLIININNGQISKYDYFTDRD
ncbi:PA2928 family protein [Flavitalea sp.]|nr:PA2928 family protein [Flavitalea sp.]